jgi:cyanophycinase
VNLAMNGLIALVGSGEYLPVMDGIDRYLLAHCGAEGRLPRVVCLPTAAGQEGDESVGRWLRMGEQHFEALGAQVSALHVTNRTEADDPHNAEIVAEADLVYFSGGNPMYLHRTMLGSRVWQAAESAWERGAIYAGCSAGAMILGQFLPAIRGRVRHTPAFGKIPARFLLPHFDRFRVVHLMAGLLQPGLKDGEFILGIDENTALVGKIGGSWQVMGKSKVYVFRRKESVSYADGQEVPLFG